MNSFNRFFLLIIIVFSIQCNSRTSKKEIKTIKSNKNSIEEKAKKRPEIEDDSLNNKNTEIFLEAYGKKKPRNKNHYQNTIWRYQITPF